MAHSASVCSGQLAAYINTVLASITDVETWPAMATLGAENAAVITCSPETQMHSGHLVTRSEASQAC
jgi:hypothetical protein